MKTFLLYGERVEFSDQQEVELKIFSVIYREVFEIVKTIFEPLFVNYKWRRKPNEEYYDDNCIYLEINDEIEAMFYSMCPDITDAFLNTLNEMGLYDFDRTEIMDEVSLAIFDGKLLGYEDDHFCDGSNLEKITAYNKHLVNDPQARLIFLTNIAYLISKNLKDFVLEELYLLKNPQVDRDLFNDDLSAFEFDDVEHVLLKNKIRPIRENIETTGINEANKGVYINTFQRDPFLVQAYFWLIDNIGDSSGELSALFSFVFGNDYILQLHIDYIMRNTLEEMYPKYLRKIKKNTNLSELKSVNESIKNLKSYYNAKWTTELEIEVENRIVDLEESKKSEQLNENNLSNNDNDEIDTSNRKRDDTPDTDVISQKELESNYRFCNSCGKKIENNMNYCIYCGSKNTGQGNIEKENSNRYNDKYRKKLSEKTWFIIMLLIVVWPAGVFFMWRHKKFNLPVRIIISIYLLVCVILVV